MNRFYWMLDATLENLIEIGGTPQCQIFVGLAIIGLGICMCAWILIDDARTREQQSGEVIRQQPE